MLTLILACILTALYAGLGAAPALLSGTIADTLRQQVGGARTVEVKLESSPPGHLLTGHVDRLAVRMEDFKLQGVAIASASLETPRFQVNVLDTFLTRQPRLMGSMMATGSVEITEAGLLTVLERPEIRTRLRGIPFQIPIFPGLPPIQRTVDVIPEHVTVGRGRIGFEGRLEMSGSAWPVALSVRPEMVDADRISLSNLEIALGGRAFPVPPGLLQTFLTGPIDLTQLAPGSDRSWSLVELAPGNGRLHMLARLRVAP